MGSQAKPPHPEQAEGAASLGLGSPEAGPGLRVGLGSPEAEPGVGGDSCSNNLGKLYTT